MQLICGIFHLDGQHAAAERLDLMLRAMSTSAVPLHRAAHLDGPVALGRLSVYAPCGETQLPKGRSGLVVSADCRLDENRRTPLPDRRHDQDEIVAALEADDPGVLGRLFGDYAVAAWDRLKQQLTLSRDGMGIRPLFYVHVPGRLFAFASRPSALLAADCVTAELDHHYLADWMLRQWSPRGQSHFRDIRKVTPGTTLTVTPDRIDQKVDWQPSPALINTGPTDPMEAAEELRRLLTQAVRCRVPASGPVASDLSGGLDSSAIALLAADALGDPSRVHGFSYLARDQDRPGLETEWPFVQAVLAHRPGLRWTPIHARGGLEWFCPQTDGDQIVPTDASSAQVQTLAGASASGAFQLLSGWGGDETASFNGRGVLAEALLSGSWRYFTRELAAYAKQRNAGMIASFTSQVLPHLIGDQLFDQLRSFGGRRGKPRTNHAAMTGFCTAGFLGNAQEQTKLPLADSGAFRLALLTSSDTSRRTEEANLTAAHYGMAILFPMLDRRVVEFTLSLPGHHFLRQGTRRWLFRQAMKDVLPPLVRNRRGKLSPIQDTAYLCRDAAPAAVEWLAQRQDDARLTAFFNVLNLMSAVSGIARQSVDAPRKVPEIKRALLLAAYLDQHT